MFSGPDRAIGPVCIKICLNLVSVSTIKCFVEKHKLATYHRAYVTKTSHVIDVNS